MSNTTTHDTEVRGMSGLRDLTESECALVSGADAIDGPWCGTPVPGWPPHVNGFALAQQAVLYTVTSLAERLQR